MIEPDSATIVTVSQLNRTIRELFDTVVTPLWLTGQVSDLTIHRSGHVYLTLKDAKAQVRGVFFNGAGKARSLGIKNGDEVNVYGTVTLYEARGTYQLSIKEMRPVGVGSLQQQFDELKKRLLAEGLFDDARKTPIPRLPSCVGVVTSVDGAALRDFLHVLGRRFAGMQVKIYPAAVQGPAAAKAIAKGITYLNRTAACDVIVITRGGGSMEDLWAFNDEHLARTIAKSKTPVISAVGHEVDFTIADFVADLRAPTPSAAAEVVVAQHADLIERVTGNHRRLVSAMRLQLASLQQRVRRAADHYVFREPLHLVHRQQQQLDDLQSRLATQLEARISRERDRVGRLESKLPLLDPRQVLERGYAILINQHDGRALLQSTQVAAGDQIHAILADGTIDLTVNQENTP